MSKLLIISHTAHYTDKHGVLVGWGSTITEINHLAEVFDEIIHIGVYHNESAPPSSLPYLKENIQFVALPPTGGKSVGEKLNIFWNAPQTIKTVFKYLEKVDIFQLRAPTGIGVYLIPILTLYSKKKGWFKYAGNWNQDNPPLGYALQRWFLKKQKRKVTINGKWPTQPKQCLTFENPCITEEFKREGTLVRKKKQFNGPFIYCFAGRLEDEKGVKRIIEAFSTLEDKHLVKEVHLVGNGDKMSEYEKEAQETGISFVFHGFIKQDDVFEIYKKSHFFLLPSSASEGFPKVIAEAMNFGCIPIVSNVSSIGQYIKQGANGFISEPNTSDNLKRIFETIHEFENENLKAIQVGDQLIDLFTYNYYINRIKNEIL